MAKIKFQKGIKWVKNPADRDLQMYEDSLALYNTFAGTNPIEIDKSFLDSWDKTTVKKQNPKRNYAPIPKGGGPWGSSFGKVIKTKTPPLNSNKLLHTSDLGGAYAGTINNINSAGYGIVPSLIQYDENSKRNNKKRDFAPIGYQSLPYKGSHFVAPNFSRKNNRLIENTPKVENFVTPQQVRSVYPNITDKEINDKINIGLKHRSYGVLDKNNKIQLAERGTINESISFLPPEEYITVPIYAKPKREVRLIGRDPEPEPEPTRPEPIKIDKIEPKQPKLIETPQNIPQPKLKLQPVVKTPTKQPGFYRPRRHGGWSKQPFLMNIFPGLYKSKGKSYQEGVKEANSYTFGKEPGIGRAIGKVLTGFADDKGKGYSISPSKIMEDLPINVLKGLTAPLAMLSGCTVDKRIGYHPQKNPNSRPSGKAGCRPPKNPGYINSIRR